MVADRTGVLGDTDEVELVQQVENGLVEFSVRVGQDFVILACFFFDTGFGGEDFLAHSRYPVGLALAGLGINQVRVIDGVIGDHVSGVGHLTDLIPGQIAALLVINRLGADEQGHGIVEFCKHRDGGGVNRFVGIVKGQYCHFLRHLSLVFQCIEQAVQPPDSKIIRLQVLQVSAEIGG